MPLKTKLQFFFFCSFLRELRNEWRVEAILGLCKFVQNISTNILSLLQRTDLKLGEITSLLLSQ